MIEHRTTDCVEFNNGTLKSNSNKVVNSQIFVCTGLGEKCACALSTKLGEPAVVPTAVHGADAGKTEQVGKR